MATGKQVRRLHIGASERREGWEVLDIVPSEIADHIGNARDLSRFPDATFAELYASHVLEHFDYINEIANVLREWERVLLPGGRLYISVPNLDVLSYIFSHEDVTTLEDKYKVMRLIFGGHMNQFDHHNAGLFPELLEKFLIDAGFDNIHTVDDFGLFKDSSVIRCSGICISLNMSAQKKSEES